MTPDERKPAGGIRAATIIPRSGGGAITPVLVEERSSYTEEILSDDGILRVHHTLTLVVPRTEGGELAALAPQMTYDGVTVEIATEAGEMLTAGWSNRFLNEQPLRLTSLMLASGARPSEGNAVVFRFESDDTAAWQELNPEDL